MIPLVKESVGYAQYVRKYCEKFDDGKYRRSNRINLVYRFDNSLYSDYEKSFVSRSPGKVKVTKNTDIFEEKISYGILIKFMIKVLVHFLFNFFGLMQKVLVSRKCFKVGRKCYVDDIFKVFSVSDTGQVLHIVHPFPINIIRQFKFVRYLKKERIPFVFSGQCYCFKDIVSAMLHRRVKDIYRAEVRSSIRYSKKWALYGLDRMEMSDEFDLSALALGRSLRFYGVYSTNKVHGIGKYLPQVYFDRFSVINDLMIDYYENISPVGANIVEVFNYDPNLNVGTLVVAKDAAINLVWVSQVFEGSGEYLKQCELDFFETYGLLLVSALPGVDKFIYRPHPNSRKINIPAAWEVCDEECDKNINIYVSFFSTVFVDPDFRGAKYLLNWEGISPALSFGENSNILDKDSLIIELDAVIKSIRSMRVMNFDRSGNVVRVI